MEVYLGIIVTLVIMEGLLSFDNALVLAIMAKRLKDPAQQRKALMYGMWGAVGFRMLFIALGVFLIKLWWLKVLGGVYLLYLAYSHFKGGDEEDADADGMLDKYQDTFLHKILRKFGIHLSLFVSTIISIEIMDLAFSVDSILAALALSDKFWVLALGGVLGIAMMRGVAGVFIKLIDKVPELEHTAFILIAIIAIKLILSAAHNMAALVGVTMNEIHVSHGLLFSILGVAFLGTFIVHYVRKLKTA